jgi:hypothetical protein
MSSFSWAIGFSLFFRFCLELPVGQDVPILREPRAFRQDREKMVLRNTILDFKVA